MEQVAGNMWTYLLTVFIKKWENPLKVVLVLESSLIVQIFLRNYFFNIVQIFLIEEYSHNKREKTECTMEIYSLDDLRT